MLSGYLQMQNSLLGPEGSGIRNMVWSEMAKVIEIFGHEVNYRTMEFGSCSWFRLCAVLEDRKSQYSDSWRDLDAQASRYTRQLRAILISDI